MSALPGRVLTLLMAGGVLYTVGVVFHLWERLPYSERDLARLRADRGDLSFRGRDLRRRRLTSRAEKPKHSGRSTLE